MYYICVYQPEDKWWLRDETAYKTFEQAYEARRKLLGQLDRDHSEVAIGKVEVWTKSRWQRLPVGFKHPEFITDSDFENAKKHGDDPEYGKERKKIKDFNALEGSLGRALREAGL